MWPFRKRQEPDAELLRELGAAIGKLRERVKQLEDEKLSREIVVFEQVQRLEKLVKKILRPDRGGSARPEASPALAPEPAREQPPPNLRGARLRIWLRDHGQPQNRLALGPHPDEFVEAVATSEAENGTGE